MEMRIKMRVTKQDLYDFAARKRNEAHKKVTEELDAYIDRHITPKLSKVFEPLKTDLEKAAVIEEKYNNFLAKYGLEEWRYQRFIKQFREINQSIDQHTRYEIQDIKDAIKADKPYNKFNLG